MTDIKIEETLDEELERLQASENLAAVENSDDIRWLGAKTRKTG